MYLYTDSKGNIIECETKIKQTHSVMFQAERANMLMRKALLGTSYLQYSDNFDYIIQSEGYKEKILFFSKLPLSASSDIVKKANLASSQANFKYSNKEEKDILENVFATNINHKTEWWIISAELISLERNSYDDCFINLQHQSIPYTEFLNNLNKYTEKKYQFVSIQEKQYDNTQEIIFSALPKNNEFKTEFAKILGNIMKQENIIHADKNSNKKNEYLNGIKTKIDNVYPIFIAFKKYLKSNSEDTIFVNYRKNAIQFANSKGVHIVWVSGTSVDPIFRINGNTYNTTKDFKKSIINGTCYIQTEWYDSIKENVIRCFDLLLNKNQPKIEVEELDW